MTEGATGPLTGILRRNRLRNEHEEIFVNAYFTIQNFNEQAIELIKIVTEIDLTFKNTLFLTKIQNRNAKTRTIPRLLNLITSNQKLFSRIEDRNSVIERVLTDFVRISKGKHTDVHELKRDIPQVSGDLAQFTKFARELKKILQQLTIDIQGTQGKTYIPKLNQAIEQCGRVAMSVENYSNLIRKVFSALMEVTQ